ncbi:MAG: formylglycine-generating enzyme family protein [Alphaproteobacteria bacterium]|nr:formylglycine-generating enzyme family protein [Alphaproteobacteria bacterium]
MSHPARVSRPDYSGGRRKRLSGAGGVVVALALAIAGDAGAAAGGSALAPGARFRDCSDCPEMVVVPAGTFVMGDATGRSSERPPVAVHLARPYAIGAYEVTFAEWEACVATGACRPNLDDHGWGRGRRPVINVSHADALAYAAWLGARAGRSCRLPSEAEWEHAARAGRTTRYWWGDAVGSGRANCRRCGGSWYYLPPVIGAASRFGRPAELGSYNVGFRVVCEIAP